MPIKLKARLKDGLLKKFDGSGNQVGSSFKFSKVGMESLRVAAGDGGTETGFSGGGCAG